MPHLRDREGCGGSVASALRKHVDQACPASLPVTVVVVPGTVDSHVAGVNPEQSAAECAVCRSCASTRQTSRWRSPSTRQSRHLA